MKLLTANRLSDGRVIYWGPGDGPVETIDQAAVLDDDEAVDILARATGRQDVWVNPYLVEVSGHTPSGRDRLKETIRARGPTVGNSLRARAV